MTNIYNLFFSLIRAEACGAKSREVLKHNITEISLQSLFDFAKAHDMAHIIATSLLKNKLVFGELADRFRNEFMMAVFRSERLNIEAERVCVLFEENQIAHLPLKGAVLRKFYPEPWMRISCDVDILVKECDMQRASDLFVEELGYTLESKGSHDWGFFTPDGFHIELHFDLIEQEVASDGIVNHTWSSDCLDNVWGLVACDEGKEYSYHMSDELFYFYHIAHMAKHFERGGCGVRSLLDLWILNNKIEQNEKERKRLLAENGLSAFSDVMTDLSEDWFSKGTCRSELEHISQYILCGGVYGNSTNSAAVRQNKNGGKFRYFFSMVFLPYYSMKLQYPILEKHKWLLAVCYIRRIFRTIFLRFNRIRSSAKTLTNISQVTLDKTKTMLKDLGL